MESAEWAAPGIPLEWRSGRLADLPGQGLVERLR
jgi:hypothetical protein